MAKYLVELYLPATTAEHQQAVALVARGGASRGVRYLRSIFLPGEETCFHEYECEDSETLTAALARAEVPYERLIEANVVA